MKIDKNFSSIYRCPKTKERVSWGAMMNSYGVCHICGNSTGSTVTHAEVVAVKFYRPSLLEWISGKRAYIGEEKSQ